MRPLKERREYFSALRRRGFDTDEIIKLVPDDELQSYVNRGSKLAASELKRREALRGLHSMPMDRDLDLGV